MGSIKNFVVGYTDIKNGNTEIMASSREEALYDFSYIISKVLLEKENVYVDHSIEEINFLSEINISINKNILLECSNTSSDEIQALVYKYHNQRGYIYNKKVTVLKYSFFIKKLIQDDTISLANTIEVPRRISHDLISLISDTDTIVKEVVPDVIKDVRVYNANANDNKENSISLIEELTKKFENGLKLNKISFDIEEKDFKSEFQKELYNKVKQRKCNKKRHVKRNR